MKNKSDVHGIIPRFCAFVSKKISTTVKMFRSDNACELTFADYFAKQGIVHQYSCVETPQQNSVVERKHQHLLNVARSLLFQSNIPISFWTDCILTATYLINRTPSPLLSHKSPYELLFDKKVDYDHLRVFGCLCFASTLKAHRTKFEPRARKCVLLGYPAGVKGYKLLGLKSKEIFFVKRCYFL